jgi:hypothetical protein
MLETQKKKCKRLKNLPQVCPKQNKSVKEIHPKNCPNLHKIEKKV